MKKTDKQRRNRTYFIAAIIFLIIIAAFLAGRDKKEELEISELNIKAISGDTAEERLARHVDTSNARITKIDNIDGLRERYSTIFRDAKNGDYIVEMPGRIIVYDFEHDRIIADFELIGVNFGDVGIR